MKRLAPCSTGPSKLAVALRRESDWRHCSLIPDRCILTVAIPMLAAIKLLHTVVWAILAGSIVVLPLTGVMRRFRWAAILSGLVLLECGVLAANGGRCPLSDLAQRFTDSHAKQFRHLPVELVSPIQQSHFRSALHRWRIGCARMLVQGEVCETSVQRSHHRDIELRIILLHVACAVLLAEFLDYGLHGVGF